MAELNVARVGPLAGLCVLLQACQSVSTTDDRPARIVNPTEQSRTELQRVVNEALHTNVLLADDALMRGSTLTIGRNVGGSIGGQPVRGRNMETPIVFKLVKNGNACVLIDQRNESRYTLRDTECDYD